MPTRLLGLLLLVGCQVAPDTPPPAAPPPAEAPAPEAPERSDSQEERPVALTLEGGGVRLIARESGAARPLAFGTPFADAVAAVSRAEGDPSEQGTQPECGAGPLAFASWTGGLTLYGRDDAFAGWAVSGGNAAPYSTMTGLGIGTTREEVEGGGLAVKVFERSLGTEFAAGDLYGLLSGDGPGAAVTHLWAGTTCSFR
jgi:hypothetical protein